MEIISGLQILHKSRSILINSRFLILLCKWSETFVTKISYRSSFLVYFKGNQNKPEKHFNKFMSFLHHYRKLMAVIFLRIESTQEKLHFKKIIAELLAPLYQSELLETQPHILAVRQPKPRIFLSKSRRWEESFCVLVAKTGLWVRIRVCKICNLRGS